MGDCSAGLQLHEGESIRPAPGAQTRLSAHLSGCGPRVDRFLDFSLPGLPGGAEVVFELEAEPEFGRGPKVSRQAQGGVGGDSPPAAHDIIEARRRDTQCSGELVHAHAQRFENVLADGFAGMGSRYKICHNIIFLMVVGDLHVAGVPILPDKTDAVLVVNSYTVLSLPGAFQGFQAVAGNRRQIAQKSRLVQMDELTERNLFDGLKVLRGLLLKHPFGRGISKRLDHKLIVYR